MSLFSDKKCVAVSWSASGALRGLRIRHRGDKIEVEAAWEAETAGQSDVPSRIAEAVSTLKTSEDLCLIAGGLQGMTTVDLKMPAKLTADQLSAALHFEVEKFSPLPIEEVHFGYRRLKKLGESVIIRLVIAPINLLEHWYGFLGEVQGGIDLLATPDSLLDPILSDCEVILPCDQNFWFRFAPVSEDEPRENELLERFEGSTFEALIKQLPQQVSLGPLSHCSKEELDKFTGAFVMALYGANCPVWRDRKTMIVLPEFLQASKPRKLLYLNLLLTAFAILSGVWYGVNVIRQDNYATRQLTNRIRAIDLELAKITTKGEYLKELDELEAKLNELIPNRPGLPNVLTYLTESLPSSHWISDFRYNNGRYKISVNSQDDTKDVQQLLIDGGRFNNVVLESRKSDPDKGVVVTLEFEAAGGELVPGGDAAIAKTPRVVGDASKVEDSTAQSPEAPVEDQKLEDDNEAPDKSEAPVVPPQLPDENGMLNVRD